MSTYLKLEMTLTYSSHFTSLDQERGAGAVNSQKKVFTIWLIPYLNMMLKLDAVIILWELFVELIRWISPLPFLISTKVRQRRPLCLMEIFREDSLFWKNSLPDCLLYPLISCIATNFDLWKEKRGVERTSASTFG